MRLLALTCFVQLLPAQIGGNGSSGPLTPAADVTLDTTANGGVFQFTTIAIPAGVTVRLRGPNPAVILCRGSASIAGDLEADAQGPMPGPGGWRGGTSTVGLGVVGETGHGPGGGAGALGGLSMDFLGKPAAHASAGTGSAPPYGAILPFDLRGGSGGGGGTYPTAGGVGPNGGGGGGALALFVDGSLTISGSVRARGGDVTVSFPPPAGRGGPGSGGAIVVRALQCVRVSGLIDAAGGVDAGSTARGGDGFVRVDGYSSCGMPDLTGATVRPAPSVAALPYLTQLAVPRLGQIWQVRCASVPGDSLGTWVSLSTLAVPFPPYGTVYLDTRPGAGFTFLGALPVPPGGIDPMAGFDLPVPADPVLVGVTFHSQMFNILGTATGRPRLSNLLSSTVLP
ncbi:MAG: hypothetical protein R3F56_21290 [Planctomycetota bacterium]